jgi:hypothetical protein
MNRISTPLTLLSLLAVLFFCVSTASAQKIVAKTKSGYTSSIEIVDVVGDSLQFKVPDGTTKQIPLADLSEDTLIRVIKEFAKRKVVQDSWTKPTTPGEIIEQMLVLDRLRKSLLPDSPTKPKTPDGNSPASGSLAGKEVKIAQLKAVPETLNGTIRMTGVKFSGVGKPVIFYDKVLADYVFFAIRDDKNALWLNCIFPKAKAAKLFSLDRGQKINISGQLKLVTSQSVTGSKSYFFEVTKLEVVE